MIVVRLILMGVPSLQGLNGIGSNDMRPGCVGSILVGAPSF